MRKESKKQKAIEHVSSYYIPSNLNLSELQERAGKLFEGCLFVISYINLKYILFDRKWKQETNPFINISRDLLVKRFGNQYKKGILLLEEMGVIICNDAYSTGNFSKAYKLTPRYAFSGDIEIFNIKKVLKGQKLEIFLKEEKQLVKKYNEVQRFILNNLKKLTLDEEEFNRVFAKVGTTPNRVKRLKVAANRIRTKNHILVEGKEQRRVYHVLTQSKKELRDCVRLDGRPLATIDVRSCQPVLLLALFLGISEAELSDYRTVLDADIYTALAPNSIRDAAKEDFLKFAFYEYLESTEYLKTKRLNGTEFARNFAARFPQITAWITAQENLSCRLQDLEAEICIYTVGAQLAEQNLFFISIHDGFLLREEDAALASTLLKAAIREKTNFIPFITMKNPNNKASELGEMYKTLSSCGTVAEVIAMTGDRDYYVSEGVWISPCGKMEGEMPPTVQSTQI